MHQLLLALAIAFVTAYAGYYLTRMREGMAQTEGSVSTGVSDDKIADLGRRRPVVKVNDVAY